MDEHNIFIKAPRNRNLGIVRNFVIIIVAVKPYGKLRHIKAFCLRISVKDSCNLFSGYGCIRRERAPANPIEHFWEKLSDFDLNEYIRATHFDDIKVPSLPFQLPTSKTYYELDKMKNGELDFLKATVLSKSQKDVFMCSDMQMDDMAKDVEFAKKYMFGLAAMRKKGLRLTVIHKINRPFNELMLGLEN